MLHRGIPAYLAVISVFICSGICAICTRLAFFSFILRHRLQHELAAGDGARLRDVAQVPVVGEVELGGVREHAVVVGVAQDRLVVDGDADAQGLLANGVGASHGLRPEHREDRVRAGVVVLAVAHHLLLREPQEEAAVAFRAVVKPIEVALGLLLEHRRLRPVDVEPGKRVSDLGFRYLAAGKPEALGVEGLARLAAEVQVQHALHIRHDSRPVGQGVGDLEGEALVLVLEGTQVEVRLLGA